MGLYTGGEGAIFRRIIYGKMFIPEDCSTYYLHLEIEE